MVREMRRFNIWAFGLFTLIVLFYIGAFFRSTLAWAPFGIVLLMLIAQGSRLDVTSRDFRGMIWFIVLMVWTFFSLIWTVDLDATISGLRNLIPKLVITFFAYKFPIWERVQVRRLGFLMAGSASILGAYFIVRHGEIRLPYAEYVLYQISWSNMIAGAIVACIPLIQFNKRSHVFSLGNFTLILCFYIVIMTESRAGFILFIAGLVLTVAFKNSIRFSKIISSLMVAPLILFGAYHMVQNQFPEIVERLDTTWNVLSVSLDTQATRLEQGAEDYTRKIQVLYTIEQMRNVPIFGVGYSAFGTSIESATGVFVQAHSLFGTFFVELGLIGFLLFASFNISLFRSLFRRANSCRHPETARVARMCIVGLVLVNILFLSRPQMSEVTYFVMLGLAMAAANRPLPVAVPNSAKSRQARCSCLANTTTLQTR